MIQKLKYFAYAATPFLFGISATGANAVETPTMDTNLQVNRDELKVPILSFGALLGFIIKLFFAVAGVVALVYLLLGAFAWITSGGDAAKTEKAQKQIVAALVGVFLIIVVLAIVATLEQVVFGGKFCFGLTCPVTIPSLIK